MDYPPICDTWVLDRHGLRGIRAYPPVAADGTRLPGWKAPVGHSGDLSPFGEEAVLGWQPNRAPLGA